MCHGELRAADWPARFGGDLAARFAPERAALEPLASDGLVELDPDGGLRVTPLGRLVLRNVAVAFDADPPGQRAGERSLFSQTV